MVIDRETAREHFCILRDALYSFHSTGGNLHVLVDDGNTDDETIEHSEKYVENQKQNTADAQLAIEKAILNLFKPFNKNDRDYILLGVDIDKSLDI